MHLKYYETDPGEVTVDFASPEHYQGYPVVLHDGIAALILDEMANRAHMGIFPLHLMVTVKLDVNYRKNIPLGKPLKIIGKAGKDRDSRDKGWSDIYNQEGELPTEANVLVVDVPNSPDPSELQELG